MLNQKYNVLMTQISEFSRKNRDNRKLAHELAIAALEAAIDNHCEPLTALANALVGKQKGEFVAWVKTHGKPAYDTKAGRFYLPKGSKKPWDLDGARRHPFWVEAPKQDKEPAPKAEASIRLTKYLKGIEKDCAGDHQASKAVETALAVLEGRAVWTEKELELQALRRTAQERAERIDALNRELHELRKTLAGLDTATVLTREVLAELAEAA